MHRREERKSRARRARSRLEVSRSQQLKRLGPYVLLGKIGSGPTGRVYLANHEEYNRPSAVKILRKRFEGSAQPLLDRFRQSMRLDHDNIASARSADQVGDRVYIASEYVDGSPITEFSFTLEQSLDLMILVSGAIGAAHHAGVVHGNLKPGNILLDEESRPVVTDFCVPSSTSEPHYFPPEQASGESGPTREGDLYGLGAILYGLLHQRPPYPAGSSIEMLHAIAEARPIPLNVGPELAAVLRKAMARDPGDRYRSAVEFAQAAA